MNELKKIIDRYNDIFNDIQDIREENNIIYFKIENYDYLEYRIYYKNEFLIIENRLLDDDKNNEFNILIMINILLYENLSDIEYRDKIISFLSEILIYNN